MNWVQKLAGYYLFLIKLFLRSTKRLNSVENENLEDTEVMPIESSTKRQSDNRTCKGKLQKRIEKNMLTAEPEMQKQIDLSIKIRNEMSLFIGISWLLTLREQKNF